MQAPDFKYDAGKPRSPLGVRTWPLDQPVLLQHTQDFEEQPVPPERPSHLLVRYNAKVCVSSAHSSVTWSSPKGPGCSQLVASGLQIRLQPCTVLAAAHSSYALSCTQTCRCRPAAEQGSKRASSSRQQLSLQLRLSVCRWRIRLVWRMSQ